ncbi:type VI secretion system baseplate subunit TssE [Salinisphaera sp. Q1T1-3]|uniref:type VI secretion system baseplate subunit TssE n=1 Tax=Salinisphaera sp. Q1T1-3 TaxID=2321229 RepID=UPI000E7422D2|nr:type VI secretion system baseplate subunit TssE [Salinisphaera sp. Q1T1-3]
MDEFEPSLFEKLLDDDVRAPATGVARRLNIEQVKESVARDLEALLNTRLVLADEALERFPECQRSILSYGLSDFSGLSLANSYDRAYVCRSLERAIDHHEPRLTNVRATLEMDYFASSKLRFAISALLVVHPAQEPVNFDAMLQPSTLQYEVSKSRRLRDH